MTVGAIHKLMNLDLELLQKEGGVDMGAIQKVFDGSEKLYYKMLARFVDTSLVPYVNQITEAFSN
jgi:hypothetical protein